MRRVAAIGGGTKNDILLRSVSAIAGVTQTVVDSDGAALGDAALAALPVMLVSNYPDAQQEAQAAGAVPGFGKAQVSSPETLDLLRTYLA